MKTYRNKFKASNHLLPVRRMPGVISHPGFHTSTNFDVACVYALTRCEDKRFEGSYAINYVTDYPVVAVLDMRGMKKYLDYDADITIREVLDDELGNIVKEHINISQYTDNDIYKILSNEVELYNQLLTCQKYDSAVDCYSANIYEYMSLPISKIYDEIWAPDFIRSYANTRVIPDWVLMFITEQYRYIDDVPEERIVGVYYLNPLANRIFESEDEEEDLIAEKYWPGFDCPYIYDITDGIFAPTRTLVYGKNKIDDSQLEMFEDTVKCEYHGTMLSLLKKALPSIAKNLPDPPCPPFKPEDMTQKEYHKRAVEFRNKLKYNNF